MWSLGSDVTQADGHKVYAPIAWFTHREDALAALRGFNYRYRVVYQPGAMIVAS